MLNNQINLKMDFNIPQTITMDSNDTVTKVDYAVVVSLWVGFWAGYFVTNMIKTCTLFNPDKKKMNELYDNIEEYEKIVEMLTIDNDDLEDEIAQLKNENGNLVADQKADEFLIKKLKDEIQRMDHKLAGFESDAHAYEAELAEFYNVARRKRLLTPPAVSPSIRKRHRSDSDVEV